MGGSGLEHGPCGDAPSPFTGSGAVYLDGVSLSFHLFLAELTGEPFRDEFVFHRELQGGFVGFGDIVVEVLVETSQALAALFVGSVEDQGNWDPGRARGWHGLIGISVGSVTRSEVRIGSADKYLICTGV